MTACIRCGWCCFNHGLSDGKLIETKCNGDEKEIISHVIMIIKPEAVADEVDTSDPNVWVMKPLGTCPHLAWTAHGNAVCNIHHYPWYKKTPCFDYQGEKGPNDVCDRGFNYAVDGKSLCPDNYDG